jgi:serine phosphatase RsbU (regulator of sigma subunit)
VTGLERIDATLSELVDLAHAGEPVIVSPDESADRSTLAALGSECLVPLAGRASDLLGLICLGPRRSDEPYSGEDRRLLAAVSRQAGLALENITLAERIATRIEAEQRLQREMEIARQVQRKLFPQRFPALATISYAGACLQARAVGGDYYDFLDFGPGSIGFVLADISGKGIHAALLMASLQANLRSQYALARSDLASLLESVDRLFFESTASNHFATMFFGRYEDASRRLVYANCGHNPPLLARADGHVDWLEPTTSVLGLFDVWRCQVADVEIGPGDMLLLYTDGVTEALSDGGEEFGESRLIEVVERHRDLEPGPLLTAIVTSVQQFSGTEQEDDVTMVAIRGR